MPSVVVTLVLVVAAAALVHCSCARLARATAALEPVRSGVVHRIRDELAALDTSLQGVRERSSSGDGG